MDTKPDVPQPALPQIHPAPRKAFLSSWAKPLRVHLSFIIVILLIAVSAPLMFLTWRQGTEAALDSAEDKMNLLSQHTVDLYTSVFQSGAAAVQMGSVLPSLAAEPPAYFDNKREFLIRTLRGSPQLDGLYLGYPSGAFVQMINVARNARWRAAVSAPDKTAFAMRTILPAADGSSTSTWRFIDDAGAILDQRSAPNLDYDPRLRPWYRAAVGRNVPVSLGRYVSASTDSLTYSVASGLWQHTDIVMGADVLLETISLLLTNSAVSDHATGYIFDADDQLIVHSERTRMKAIVDGFEEPKGRGARTGDDDLALKAIRQLLSTTRDRNNRLIEIR